MRRIVVAIAVALVGGALSATAALADGGPHGSYDRLMDGTLGATDKCAACHRPHQGQSAGFLLKRATQYELCASCHDGTVSRLDVLDGVKLGATITPRVPGQNPGGATTLNGGGFEFIAGVATTSRHNVRTSLADTGESQPWGYLADTGTKVGTLSQPLTCTSCHNPHGSANYRIINEKVNTYGVSVLAYYGGAFTKQEGTRGLEAGVPADKYSAEYYGGAGMLASGGYRPDMGPVTAGDAANNGFAQLCGSCHTSYPSSTAKTIPAANPWTITKYRHRTEMAYDLWISPKYGGSVPNNPETNPYDANGAEAGGLMPALRLASNTTDADKIVTCLTCHRAHGTTTVQSGFALNTAFGGANPDVISPAQSSTSTSMLLFTDNRAMCEACHQW